MFNDTVQIFRSLGHEPQCGRCGRTIRTIMHETLRGNDADRSKEAR
jgi:bacterioferritin-associated ferredoxin